MIFRLKKKVARWKAAVLTANRDDISKRGKKATVSPSEWRKICLGIYATLLRADRRNGTAGIANIRPTPFSRTACIPLFSSFPLVHPHPPLSLSFLLFRAIFKKADSFFPSFY